MYDNTLTANRHPSQTRGLHEDIDLMKSEIELVSQIVICVRDAGIRLATIANLPLQVIHRIQPGDGWTWWYPEISIMRKQVAVLASNLSRRLSPFLFIPTEKFALYL